MNRRNVNKNNHNNIYSEYIEGNATVKSIAEKYDISRTSVYRIVKKMRDNNIKVQIIPNHLTVSKTNVKKQNKYIPPLDQVKNKKKNKPKNKKVRKLADASIINDMIGVLDGYNK